MQISKRFLENEIKTPYKENKHLMSTNLSLFNTMKTKTDK